MLKLAVRNLKRLNLNSTGIHKRPASFSSSAPASGPTLNAEYGKSNNGIGMMEDPIHSIPIHQMLSQFRPLPESKVLRMGGQQELIFEKQITLRLPAPTSSSNGNGGSYGRVITVEPLNSAYEELDEDSTTTRRRAVGIRTIQYRMSSVLKKRRKKMRKHKDSKRWKKTRPERRRKAQIKNQRRIEKEREEDPKEDEMRKTQIAQRKCTNSKS